MTKTQLVETRQEIIKMGTINKIIVLLFIDITLH